MRHLSRLLVLVIVAGIIGCSRIEVVAEQLAEINFVQSPARDYFLAPKSMEIEWKFEVPNPS